MEGGSFLPPGGGLTIGALKRYRSLGGGGHKFYKFTDRGQCLEGIWRGSKMNKFNTENGLVETPDGIINEFSLAAMLKDLLKVPDGTGVKITYLGIREGKNYGHYQTLVEEDYEGDGESNQVPF